MEARDFPQNWPPLLPRSTSKRQQSELCPWPGLHTEGPLPWMAAGRGGVGRTQPPAPHAEVPRPTVYSPCQGQTSVTDNLLAGT